ncbi:MAG: hypothetical protein GX629_04620 [Phycisphaerae bacterium]|nr:hypothetical protein [Phycisphaerae bacterium]
MRTVVHVTHEAVEKVGGIGAVLEGLITSSAYNASCDRTVLVCPLFSTYGPAESRLGPDGEVLYSSVDGMIRSEWASKFRPIEERFNVGIVYGHRSFIHPDTKMRVSAEVLLIDITRIDHREINHFKGRLWEHFGIESIKYENSWDFDQYVKLAPPALAAIESIGAVPHDGHCVIVAHEFMGMPTALAAILSENSRYRTVFYAHETATMRKIVEELPGHDTVFYNVLRKARSQDMYLDDVFGSQDHYFKHALISATKYCDNILAVGDYVMKEFRFLGPEFNHVDIDLCYNGIPSSKIDLKDKLISKLRLQRYCETLLDYRPDYVFTHVSRLTVSKGLWRDLKVLEHVEKAFRQQNKTAVMYFLTTELPRRRPEDVLNMEQWWRWPVAHREGLPDLSHGEAALYTGIQEFNAKARNVKVLLINQFGFDQATCGKRIPADTEFLDIRRGSDLEFGQSVYEPFGIAMLEPLTFGGLCVVTNVCGCVGFVEDVTKGQPLSNFILADYTNLDDPSLKIEDLLKFDQVQRDLIEKRIARKLAEEILRKLPKNNDDMEGLIQSGYQAASHMGWDVVAKNYFLPAVDRACRKQRVLQMV